MDNYSLNIYKQRMVKLDILLCNYCNLNCSACMFGTNTKELPRLIYDLEQFKKDMNYLSKFKDIIKEIHFLGGEPTLVKNILEYVQITKEALPTARIHIITNGLKLVKDENLLRGLKDLNVRLILSHYPETTMVINVLEQKLKLFNIFYTFLVSDHSPILKNVWSAPLTTITPMNTSNLEEFKFKCKYGCLLIWNGYFMACAIQFSIPMRNKLFGTNYKEEKGIPIESIKTEEDLIEMQGSKYIPDICKYCQPGTNIIKWVPHTINKIKKEYYIL